MGAIHHQDHLCHNSASTAGEGKKKKKKETISFDKCKFQMDATDKIAQ